MSFLVVVVGRSRLCIAHDQQCDLINYNSGIQIIYDYDINRSVISCGSSGRALFQK